VLAGVSVVGVMAVTLTWAHIYLHYRETIWGEIVRLFYERGSSRLVEMLTKNVLAWAGPNRLYSAAVVCAVAAVAFLVALVDAARARATAGEEKRAAYSSHPLAPLNR
jgi:hypothetical protein